MAEFTDFLNKQTPEAPKPEAQTPTGSFTEFISQYKEPVYTRADQVKGRVPQKPSAVMQGVGDVIAGTVETPLALVNNAISGTAATIAGPIVQAFGGDGMAARKWIQENFTYTPKSQSGQASTELIGKVGEATIGQIGNAAANVAEQMGADPLTVETTRDAANIAAGAGIGKAAAPVGRAVKSKVIEPATEGVKRYAGYTKEQLQNRAPVEFGNRLRMMAEEDFARGNIDKPTYDKMMARGEKYSNMKFEDLKKFLASEEGQVVLKEMDPTKTASAWQGAAEAFKPVTKYGVTLPASASLAIMTLFPSTILPAMGAAGLGAARGAVRGAKLRSTLETLKSPIKEAEATTPRSIPIRETPSKPAANMPPIVEMDTEPQATIRWKEGDNSPNQPMAMVDEGDIDATFRNLRTPGYDSAVKILDEMSEKMGKYKSWKDAGMMDNNPKVAAALEKRGTTYKKLKQTIDDYSKAEWESLAEGRQIPEDQIFRTLKRKPESELEQIVRDKSLDHGIWGRPAEIIQRDALKDSGWTPTDMKEYYLKKGEGRKFDRELQELGLDWKDIQARFNASKNNTPLNLERANILKAEGERLIESSKRPYLVESVAKSLENEGKSLIKEAESLSTVDKSAPSGTMAMADESATLAKLRNDPVAAVNEWVEMSNNLPQVTTESLKEVAKIYQKHGFKDGKSAKKAIEESGGLADSFGAISKDDLDLLRSRVAPAQKTSLEVMIDQVKNSPGPKMNTSVLREYVKRLKD